MRKVKIWGGTHPDELGPMELVDSLPAHPIPNVSGGIVNIEARRAGLRFIDINMNAAYPGDPESSVSEERRAPEVLRASQGFDIVVDLHANNMINGFDTAYIGNRGVSSRVLGFLSELGIKQLISTRHNQLAEHVPNCFLLDLVASHYDDLPGLRSTFDRLANDPSMPQAKPEDFEWYAHAGSVTVSQFDPNNLPYPPVALEPVPEQVAPLIGGGKSSVYWLAAGVPNGKGYWAELCTPIDPPDNTNWPSD